MTDDAKSAIHLETLSFLLSSFTDNGRSLRAFASNPHELAITVLTAGLLANSKLLINPEDAIKSAFDIYARIQNHVGQYESMKFVSNIENCFTDKPPEVEHD